ncbi:hypothetical protein [Kribbella sp.]|uniref:hypothetical protein n=1 Tax=Kribbella sp. TaxID=1871183 RepID=UPI002D67A932|nr:hypothetical protein [Kribbella sp.]HZX05008.1 hypothetical protein [Kribbella sp.]
MSDDLPRKRRATISCCWVRRQHQHPPDRSGHRDQPLYGALGANGPFSRIGKASFLALLADLGTADVLTQSCDQLVNHCSFYTAFQIADDYRLVVCGRTLGSIPVGFPVLVGSRPIFAGHRWRVLDVDRRSRAIELTRSSRVGSRLRSRPAVARSRISSVGGCAPGTTDIPNYLIRRRRTYSTQAGRPAVGSSFKSDLFVV